MCCTHCWFEKKKKNKQKIKQFAQYDLRRGHWLFRTLRPKQAIRLLIRKLENYRLESPRQSYSLQMLPKCGHLFHWPERSKPKLQKCLHPLKPSLNHSYCPSAEQCPTDWLIWSSWSPMSTSFAQWISWTWWYRAILLTLDISSIYKRKISSQRKAGPRYPVSISFTWTVEFISVFPVVVIEL